MTPFRLFSRDTSPVSHLHCFEVAVKVVESGSVQGTEQLITATCVTDSEVDYWIDKLIDNLNQVRRSAKAKIAKNRNP